MAQEREDNIAITGQIISTMSSLATRRVISQLLMRQRPSTFLRVGGASNTNNVWEGMMMDQSKWLRRDNGFTPQHFSTAAEEATPSGGGEAAIPGVGKYKTSTGLVRSIASY